jgi:hypothetical protein
VFVLFFGVAALEAFQTRNWLKAAFWLAIGLVFLVADNRGKRLEARGQRLVKAFTRSPPADIAGGAPSATTNL